jgi:methionyl aminopeptidase
MDRPSDEQIIAGRVVRDTIKLGITLCEKEVTGTQLDARLEEYIKDNGCVPSLKGYKPPFSERTYKHAICLSLNKQAVHGVPQDAPLSKDDLITIDLVAAYKGWHADSARTFTFSTDFAKKIMVEKITTVHTNALSIIAPNLPIKIYSEFCQRITEEICSASVLKEFCGHGIGRDIHEPPQIPCSQTNDNTNIFLVGRSYAVEPVIACKKQYILSDGDDGWVVSADCLTAHMEDTIFVSNVGIFNLTN